MWAAPKIWLLFWGRIDVPAKNLLLLMEVVVVLVHNRHPIKKRTNASHATCQNISTKQPNNACGASTDITTRKSTNPALQLPALRNKSTIPKNKHVPARTSPGISSSTASARTAHRARLRLTEHASDANIILFLIFPLRDVFVMPRIICFGMGKNVCSALIQSIGIMASWNV